MCNNTDGAVKQCILVKDRMMREMNLATHFIQIGLVLVSDGKTRITLS